LIRLGAFAPISQPFYIFAFHPWDWRAEWVNLNIFFTLLVSLLAMWGLHTKKWWLFIAMFLLANLVNFDYSGGGDSTDADFLSVSELSRLGRRTLCPIH